MIIVVMGVAGTGKTTIGQMLAHSLQCPFLDGDSLHSPANLTKMANGVPLSDADRGPWLAAIWRQITNAAARRQNFVVACSALKQRYRDYLADGNPITWVYLKGAPDLIRQRLEHRHNHYMRAEMLPSQLAILEEPTNAISIDVSLSPSEIVARILSQLPR